MATNFPTSLDSLTNPTASDKLNSVTVPHASQHATLNDAVEALEAKVGVNSSAVTTSHDYLIDKQSVVPYDDASARTTAVPSPVEGQMSYLKDTNSVEVYDGSAWSAVGGGGGLVFISRTTIGSAVSSVTVSGAFSADYDNYKIVFKVESASTGSYLELTLGAATTGYYRVNYGGGYSASATVTAYPTANDTKFNDFLTMNTGGGGGVLEIQSPFLADQTFVQAAVANTVGVGHAFGYLNDTTSHTSITFTTESGTITGGTIDVYGYAKA